jgi:hypothetical protein
MPDTKAFSGETMNHTICRAVLLAAALAVPAAAQNASEGLAAAAGARFQAVSLEALNGGFRPALSAGMPKLDAAGADDFMRDWSNSSSILRPGSFRAAATTQAADLDLAALLNRHLKTTLRFQLSGKTVWFSGTFDRQQNPFVSVLVDGSAPLYFNVKSLLDADQHLNVAGVAYTLSLSANIFRRMHSTINLKNDGNSREAARFTLQDMLDAVSAAGQDVRLSDQAYKFYYADGIGERMFVFVYGSTKDFHVYLIPESQVPPDRIGVFALFNGKRVGLSHGAGKLAVFENP